MSTLQEKISACVGKILHTDFAPPSIRAELPRGWYILGDFTESGGILHGPYQTKAAAELVLHVVGLAALNGKTVQ